MLAFCQPWLVAYGAKSFAVLCAKEGGYSAVSSLTYLSPFIAPAMVQRDPGGCVQTLATSAMLSNEAQSAPLL